MIEMPSGEKADEIRAKRQQGASWLALLKETGLSMYVLKCTCDPTFQEKLRTAVRSNRERRRNGYIRRANLKKEDQARMSDPDGSNRFGHAAVGIYVSSISVPASVAEQQERLLNFKHSDNTARLLGDPPPWRSALGKRK